MFVSRIASLDQYGLFQLWFDIGCFLMHLHSLFHKLAKGEFWLFWGYLYLKKKCSDKIAFKYLLQW